MDRALQANIIAKSGKAVELAGDVDIVLLDKTGTITSATECHNIPAHREVFGNGLGEARCLVLCCGRDA